MKRSILKTMLFVFVLVMLPLDLILIFKVAPTERIMGIVQKIFYIHVPLAMSAYIGFAGVFVSSIMFLWKKDLAWDT
ncbi:MAG TPA: cytochrome C assembly protein, partial [Nitrospirae bacterium]|nr:cytochrome C assembly protein [Nitrospirota bacterium]